MHPETFHPDDGRNFHSLEAYCDWNIPRGTLDTNHNHGYLLEDLSELNANTNKLKSSNKQKTVQQTIHTL